MILYTLLLPGKTKLSFLTEGIEEYIARLSHYARVKYTTVNSSKCKGSAEVVKEKEAKLLLGGIDEKTTVVALDQRGRQHTSTEFAGIISAWEQRGVKKVAFIIGGPFGLADSVLQRAELVLSLSKMTFTHDMARLFLLEQLYRAYTIKAGEKYHK